MTADNNYTYVVIVTAADGRYATQSVFVDPVVAGSTQPSITTSSTRFNIGSRLVLSGYLSGNIAVRSVWSVFSSGVSVPITTSTQTSRAFSASQVQGQIAFPLSINSGVFFGGVSYTFRLAAYSTNTSISAVTYSEVVLTANAPPTGGYLLSSPTVGKALVTSFSIASPGWTSNAANFPLSFSFSYRLSALASYLTIAVPSTRPSTTTTLPSGLSTENYTITLQGEVTDIFAALSAASTSVSVTLSPQTNISHVLTSTLNSAFSSGNINLAFQTVNNVSEAHKVTFGLMNLIQRKKQCPCFKFCYLLILILLYSVILT